MKMTDVVRRAGGACEAPGCGGPDFRGLQFAHITHRKMGGRHGSAEAAINDPRNVVMLCAAHHDILDGRDWQPEEKAELMAYLKQKIDWDTWKEEHSGNILS